MTVPVVNAVINFSTGPGFAQTCLIDSGIFGTNVFGDSTSVIVDVSDRIDYIKTRRGRDAVSDEFQAGQLTLRIIDQNGDFNPQNVTGPYYELLSPMRKVQITATYEGVTYPIFSGFITSYLNTQPQEATALAYTTIQAIDAFRLAQLAQVTTVADASAGDLTGTRINQILDEIEWPNSMRDVDAGQTTVQDDPGTLRTSLFAMQTVATTEYGALYVDASGSFVFQDRDLTTASITLPTTDFNDDGTGISYVDANWVLNDVLIYNKATVTRTGGTPQVATNQASIDKYFLHSFNEKDLLMETDAEALDFARAYVASRQETSIRCDSIDLDLYTPNYNAGIIAALDLDFFDPITVTTTQPGGSTISKTLQIFGVQNFITPNSFKTTFTTLEPIIDGFIIGYGRIDIDTLSY
jgi:VCBS repeat-containing protein